MEAKKVYKSTNTMLFVGLFIFVALYGVRIFLTGHLFPQDIHTYVEFVLLLSLIFYFNYRTSIVVSKDKIVSHAPIGLFFLTREFPIDDIDMILRVRPPVYRGLGDNYITIYAKDGLPKTIHEAYYEVSALKEFLTALKKKRPLIELDEQYQQLISGKVPCDASFRHVVPKHTEFFNEMAYNRYDPFY